jgi:hypothetical protein
MLDHIILTTSSVERRRLTFFPRGVRKGRRHAKIFVGYSSIRTSCPQFWCALSEWCSAADNTPD